MAKRFTTIFLITLATAVACVVLFVLVLFMAPGMSVLGLKYIQTNTHVISKRFTISEALKDDLRGGDFSGSIRVEVDDIPVSVVFSLGFQYEVLYYDNYCGLTNSKFDDPSIDVSRDDDGTAVIKVTSFKTFVYENANSTRYLKILIPAATVATSQAGQTDITIVSDKSSVSFADEKNDNFNPYFHQISISTAGKISCGTNVKADTYVLNTLNSINIDKDEKKAINATNYILTSTGGKITVNREVAGNIEAKTSNASIKILSCNNFTANSGWGNISCSDNKKKITVNGTVNIKTTAGMITLGSVLGEDAKSIINSKTGHVSVDKINNVEITTTRGSVFVKSAKNVSAKTSSGLITIEEATASANVTTKRGKVTLGGDNAVMVNPTVTSTFGKVTLSSASGFVSVETVNANVEFKNRDAVSIKLNVGGTLKAENLTGGADITVSGNATLSFTDFTSDTKINNTGAGTSMTINLLNNPASSFAYSLEGTEAKLMEYNEEDVSNHRQLEVSTIVTGGQIGQPKLTVTSKGKMIVFCKMAVG